MKAKSHLLTTALFATGVISIANAQQIFSYDFVDSNVTPWENPWVVTHTPLPGMDPGSNAQLDEHSLLLNGNRVAGVLTMRRTSGQSTGVNTNFSFNNLATNSAIIRQIWTPWRAGQVNSLNFGMNELFRIGLISDSSTQFVDAASDSFFLSGLEMGVDNALAPTTSSLQLAYRDESGAPLLILGTMDFLTNVTDANGTYRYAYNISQEFIPTSSPGLYDINVIIDQWRILEAGSFPGYTYSDEYIGQFASYSATGIKVKLLSSTLADAHVGLGINLNDNTSASISGANFDGGVAIVPEPSASLLALLAAPLAFYRRRK